MAQKPSPHIAAKPSLPVALFLLGVADDGMAKISVEPPDYAISHTLLGSLNHYDHTRVPGLEKQMLVMVGNQHQKLRFAVPHVIVNCIVDADMAGNALTQAQSFIDKLFLQHRIQVPVINPPAGIARTRRETIYNEFRDTAGMHIPRAIRITPVSVADTIAQIKAASISLPFIIRSTGSHGGRDMQRIDDWSQENLLRLERYAYDGRAFYITEWTDFKNGDGLYRKYRILMVNGELVARHLIVSDNWMIHSRSREVLMKTSPALREEEQDFLKNPEKIIRAESIAGLRSIHQSLGLDYFGMDCSIRDDGTLVVFEINAAFNAMVQNGLGTYPYLEPPMKRVIEAFNNMVAGKVAAGKAA